MTRPLQVLVVESDFALAMQYQLELLGAGHSANIVSNAEDALAVATPAYDLVITDLRLPGMSGEEFIRELHGRTEFSNLPVLVLSAAGELPPSVRNGSTTLHRKPFNWDNFIGFVTDAAGKRRPH